MGANVTIPHKVAALELADEASEAARAIGAANTLSFTGGRIAAENTDASGFLDSLPAPPAGSAPWCSAPGLGARGGLGPGHGGRPRFRSGTAPPRGPSAWRMSWARGASVGRRAHWRAGSFNLIVNTTTVGMGASGKGLRTSRACPSVPIRWARHTNWWTSPTGPPRRSSPGWRGRTAPRSSTGSRCWFARGPRRFASGRDRTPRSRRCAGPPEPDRNLEQAPRPPETSAGHGRGDRPQARGWPHRGRRRRAHRADAAAATRGCSSPT